MKQGTLTTKIMMTVLVLGVVIYLAIYFVQGWNNELVTTPAYAASVNVGIEASGIVVREESLISGSGAFVDLVPNEGERVASGETVAIIYSDSSGLDTRQEIKTITAEIEQLSYALSSGTSSTDTSKLDSSVLQSIINLRALSVSGDLSSLEDSTLNLRTMVFKRDYTYGDSGAATGIAALIQEKQGQLAALQASLNRVSTSIRTAKTGIFSGVADGYETLISPDTLLAMTPSELTALLERDVSAPADTVGKLITSSTWYFAVVLSAEEAIGLVEGRTYTINFSHDWFGSVDMQLEQISDREENQVLVVFSSRTNLSDTTLIRKQTVDIVTSQLDGIRIPRQALRVITEEIVDETTGKTVEVQHTGVYTVVGSQAEFQEVTILYTDDNFYLVKPVNEDSARRLRAGDDIILAGKGIYDGKVVR